MIFDFVELEPVIFVAKTVLFLGVFGFVFAAELAGRFSIHFRTISGVDSPYPSLRFIFSSTF